MTTTLLLAPPDRLNAYINSDYGRNSSPTGVTSPWKGIAGAAKVQLNDRFALMPRLPWFDDTNGFSTGTARPSSAGSGYDVREETGEFVKGWT